MRRKTRRRRAAARLPSARDQIVDTLDETGGHGRQLLRGEGAAVWQARGLKERDLVRELRMGAEFVFDQLTFLRRQFVVDICHQHGIVDLHTLEPW
ncbi:hypothetical protein [Paraburkholderia bengalensis]|uniref:hypothetical protein n=1 Tax=Paraburkholderia bengalensis TaxID=2747562 RepID=UPI0030152069